MIRVWVYAQPAVNVGVMSPFAAVNVETGVPTARVAVVGPIIASGTGTPYTGEYTATPKIAAQTLPTAKRYLEKDVTVEQIPRFDVSNASGTTVYIAKALDE